MANKLRSWCRKSIPILFTSIVAPLFVNLAVRNTPEAVSSPAHSEQTASPQLAYPTVSSFVLSPAAPPKQIVRIIASGTGRTTEAALQDAVQKALRQALVSLVGAETLAANDATLYASVLQNVGGVLLGWKDLGGRKEWKARGSFYHEEVAVEVNLTALADRLRVRHFACWNNPNLAAAVQGSALLR